jgi:hypothetical protein
MVFDMIDESDLEMVRAVLAGEVSSADAARRYPAAPLVILAHTCLSAGDFNCTAWRGQLGELLYQLALAPAVPAEGWPRDDDWEEPYLAHRRKMGQLMPTSRRLGLHVGGSGTIRLTPAPEILDLLSNAELRRAAQTLYGAAARVVNAARAERQSYADRTRRMRQAAAGHPGYGRFFEDHLLSCFPDPADWAAIHTALGELLRMYFPEHVPK